MVILRPTRKLRSSLPVSSDLPKPSDNALGDWYVNRIVVDRRPLLLLVSSTSLLPLLMPARDVRELPNRIADLVEQRLTRMGITSRVVEAECQAMNPVSICPTSDRSILGIMVDFAKAVPYYLEPGQWGDASLALVEDLLAQTPCYAGRSFDHVVFPEKRAPEVLRTRWAD